MNTDYIFGTNNEVEFIDILKSKFGDDIIQVENKNCTYDYENDEYIFELKSRRNEKLKYATKMIGYNKIKSYKKLNKKVVLCFKFTDCNCYYEYDENDKFEVKRGGRKDRGRYEYTDYLFIPVEKLIDF